MRNVLYKSCRENQNTLFMFNNLFSETLAVHEIMSKTLVEPEEAITGNMAARRVECWIRKPKRAQHIHPHMGARTHTHLLTQTEICNTY
jgi:hypothetical protein